MKTTKRELKRIIAEEIKHALKEQSEAPFDVDPKSGGKVDAGAADPLEMLKRVKEMVDKAIAEVEAAAGSSAEKKGHKYVPTKVDPSLDKPRPYSPDVESAMASMPKSYR